MATVTFPTIGNNGITTLATGISDSITTVVVTSAAALGFTDSTTDGYITIVDASNYRKNPLTSPETLEICQVTAVSTNTLTVTRGVDGTSGTVFAAGAVIEVRINAAMIQRVYDALTDGTDDINVGGATFAGDVEVGGDLTTDAAAGGCNKTWELWLAPNNGLYYNAGDTPTDTGFLNYAANRRVSEVFEFSSSVVNRGYASFALPYDYQSDSLIYDFFWSQNGTASGNMKWTMQTFASADGGDMTPTGSGGNVIVVDAAPAVAGELVISSTPAGKPHDSSGADTAGYAPRLMHLGFFRNPPDASDTLTDSVYLIGIRVRYA